MNSEQLCLNCNHAWEEHSRHGLGCVAVIKHDPFWEALEKVEWCQCPAWRES